MTNLERIELLSRLNWHNRDIKSYFGYGNNKCCEIRKRAVLEFGGADLYNSKVVRVQAVFKAIGIDYNNELSRLRTEN